MLKVRSYPDAKERMLYKVKKGDLAKVPSKLRLPGEEMVLVLDSVAWVESPQEHFPPLPNCQAILTTQKLIISVEHVAPDILPTYIKRYLTIPWNTIL